MHVPWTTSSEPAALAKAPAPVRPVVLILPRPPGVAADAGQKGSPARQQLCQWAELLPVKNESLRTCQSLIQVSTVWFQRFQVRAAMSSPSKTCYHGFASHDWQNIKSLGKYSGSCRGTFSRPCMACDPKCCPVLPAKRPRHPSAVFGPWQQKPSCYSMLQSLFQVVEPEFSDSFPHFLVPFSLEQLIQQPKRIQTMCTSCTSLGHRTHSLDSLRQHFQIEGSREWIKEWKTERKRERERTKWTKWTNQYNAVLQCVACIECQVFVVYKSVVCAATLASWCVVWYLWWKHDEARLLGLVGNALLTKADEGFPGIVWKSKRWQAVASIVPFDFYEL